MSSIFEDLRPALRISLISVAWTVAAAIAAVVVGLVETSAVAVALGAVGFVDALGSAALASHFRHGVRHEQLSIRRELIAHAAVSFGLIIVGLASAAGGAYRFAAGEEADASVAVVALASVSLLALTALSVTKQRIGRRVGSRTLIGDGHLSGIGALQAAVALVGNAIAASLDAHWTDAAATIVVGALAVAVGVATWRADPTTTK